MSITSFEHLPYLSLRSNNEIIQRQRVSRERALAWIKDTSHQVKRRVLRQHLSETLIMSDLTDQTLAVVHAIGNVALGWQLNENSNDGPIAVCNLTGIDGRKADEQVEEFLNTIPGVVKNFSGEAESPLRFYMMIIPNGNTTYNVVTARRTETPTSPHGDASIYSISSEVIRT